MRCFGGHHDNDYEDPRLMLMKIYMTKGYKGVDRFRIGRLRLEVGGLIQVVP